MPYTVCQIVPYGLRHAIAVAQLSHLNVGNDAVDSCGYCLDAPKSMPAGSCYRFKDCNLGFTSYTHRDDE